MTQNDKKTRFAEAAQMPIILIDSDIVGAVRLLWNARVLELGYYAHTKTLTFQSPLTYDATQEGMADLLRKHFALPNVLANLYKHDERGTLFYSEDALPLDRVDASAYVSQYVPRVMIEVGSVMSDDGIFEVDLHFATDTPDVTAMKAFATTFTQTVNETLNFTDTPVRLRIISANVDGSIRQTTGTLDKHRIAHDSFYPYLPESLHDYIQAFYEDNASVLLIYGPPGTGKSTFIRTAIAQLGIDALLSNDENAVRTGVIFEQNFGAKPYLIALEDADNLVMSREDGNDFMSRLLNAADGICKARAKVIISTNLPSIDRIDEALIRPGRTFDILHFRPLTREEAYPVLDDLKIDSDLLPDGQHFSLAELSSLGNKPAGYFSHRRSRQRTGFLGMK